MIILITFIICLYLYFFLCFCMLIRPSIVKRSSHLKGFVCLVPSTSSRGFMAKNGVVENVDVLESVITI